MICRRRWQFISAAVDGGVVFTGADFGTDGVICCVGWFGVAEIEGELAAASEEVRSSLRGREEFLVRRMVGVEDVAVVL